MSEAKPIRCDCHGRSKMAEVDRHGRIVIKHTRHGVTHQVVIDPKRVSRDNLTKKG